MIFDLQTPASQAIFRIHAGVCDIFRNTLNSIGFTEIQSSKFQGCVTESGASVFKVDYFRRPAFLAQSPQLYKQIMVGVFERVFEVAAVYRAEEHATSRHLNEYLSLDVEMCFI